MNWIEQVWIDLDRFGLTWKILDQFWQVKDKADKTFKKSKKFNFGDKGGGEREKWLPEPARQVRRLKMLGVDMIMVGFKIVWNYDEKHNNTKKRYLEGFAI